MKRICRILLPSLSLFGARTTTSACECAGVEMQDSVTLDGRSPVLNGLGLRLATFVKVKVYVAGLYVPKQSDQAQALLGTDQPWHLVLSFLRSVDAEDMIKAWNEGFETNAKAQLPALKDRIDTLNQVLWKTTKRKAIQGVISANQKFVSVYRICRSGNRRRFSGVSQPGVGC